MDPRPLEELNIQKTGVEGQIALMSILEDNGIIDEHTDVSPTVLNNLSNVSKDLMLAHVSLTKETATVLAYIDLKVKEAEDAGASSSDIAKVVPLGLVASIITNPLLQNDEFALTVLAKAKQLMAKGKSFSSTLFEASSVRQIEIRNSGVIAVLDEKTRIVTPPPEKEKKGDSNN